ncbi:ComF family protein [Erythrobacter sp. JK5]|uniref:ComF family protein n=1 Tax=Erythrobacter sp. JK5 TaxID=2829500 RepID=UPI0035302828
MCGDAIADQGGLCVECWSQIETPGEPSCPRCLRPTGSTGRQPEECALCRIDPPRHAGIYAATLYNDASRKLILGLKHGGKIALARLLGRLMASRLPDGGAEPPVLVPVPLHRWRLLGRGFNQSVLLAGELERHGKGKVLVDALVRKKRTPSLGGLGRAQRESVLRGAIDVKTGRRERVAGKDVILVDDVLTSGATSDACVAALLDAGAASVRIACFARVVSGVESVAPNTTPEAITTPGAT